MGSQKRGLLEQTAVKGKIKWRAQKKVRTTSCCDVDLQGDVHLLRADVCFREHI